MSASSYTLTNSAGAELSFTPDHEPTLTLSNSGTTGDLFNVGGSISIGSSTQDGVYSGQIDIQVVYQ